MGKMKTHRASAKRFSVTGSGKVKMFHNSHRHNTGMKSSKRKRNLRQAAMTDVTNEKNMIKILPYL